MSLSPLVRKGVSGTATWLLAQFVGVAVGSQNFLFSSKSMLVEPDGSEVESVGGRVVALEATKPPPYFDFGLTFRRGDGVGGWPLPCRCFFYSCRRRQPSKR